MSNFEKNIIENKDISDIIRQVAIERIWLTHELNERIEEEINKDKNINEIDKNVIFEKIKRAFASNLKFAVEKKIMENEGINESDKNSILKFRGEYPLEETEREIYNKVEEFIKKPL